MTETLSLRLVRPYATEEELIAAEGWAIDKKSMVLIGQSQLESGTTVRFELLLEDGQRVLVAEGKAVSYTRPKGDRPGGAKVRFKRFNAAGKAFIERVEAAKAEAPPQPADAPAEPGVEAPPEPAAARVTAPKPHADPIEQSGIRHRAHGPVPAPENRDELLERLRERARANKAREPGDRERSA